LATGFEVNLDFLLFFFGTPLPLSELVDILSGFASLFVLLTNLLPFFFFGLVFRSYVHPLFSYQNILSLLFSLFSNPIRDSRRCTFKRELMIIAFAPLRETIL